MTATLDRPRAKRTYQPDDPLKRGSHRIVERFFDKVQYVGAFGCWEWTGNLAAGYALFRDGEKVLGHRWSYERFIGPVPDGLVLDHLCRNTRCVNPFHLEPVTYRENALRGDGPRVTRERNLRANPSRARSSLPGESGDAT